MKYAIVTGASKGIGRAIACELAERGKHLVLTARSQDLLEALAADLTAKHGIDARSIALDLSDHASTLRLKEFVGEAGLSVDMLINNAGFSMWGPFKDVDLAQVHKMSALNIDAVLRLTHHFLPHLLAQPKSYLLNVSSLGGYVPLPYKANYGASKAYITAFTRALRFELREEAIHVCALCPGGVRTETTKKETLGTAAARNDRMFIDPDTCARIAIDALYRNQAEIIPGVGNRLGNFFSKFLNRSTIVRMAGGIFDPEK